jgi:hypothetical protein
MIDLFIKIKIMFPARPPRYFYPGEQDYINPAYCNIEACAPLCPNETRIWVFRGDGIVATGIKNALVEEGNIDLFQKVDESFHKYMQRDNRYGHPSLAIPEGEYDGAVYYAGWLCQRQDHIQVLLQSGRFFDRSLSDRCKQLFETYVAGQFIRSYGDQDVIFYDCTKMESLVDFFSGPFPKTRVGRIYNRAVIEAELTQPQ